MLGLETVGEITELVAEDTPPTGAKHRPTVLRSSHHAIARLDAKGLRVIEIAAQVGMSVVRIQQLRECPSYRELVAHYGRDSDHVAQMIEEKFQLIAEDAAGIIHEKLLDKGTEMPLDEAVEVFKTFADRAGFAPVHRTVNKNLNLNIGARLDEARRRKEIDER